MKSGTPNFSKFLAWHHSRGLVVDAALEARGTPVLGSIAPLCRFNVVQERMKPQSRGKTWSFGVYCRRAEDPGVDRIKGLGISLAAIGLASAVRSCLQISES